MAWASLIVEPAWLVVEDEEEALVVVDLGGLLGEVGAVFLVEVEEVEE